ncbi:gata zinc finger domain-containing protein [Favolaschia claudopus]|uniref:Gata zinc finger domain-containing protein n=1 Tax=Favolaschia claudopus TaxID=2862362 RepID=A0AAW0D729_9AGAR
MDPHSAMSYNEGYQWQWDLQCEDSSTSECSVQFASMGGAASLAHPLDFNFSLRNSAQYPPLSHHQFHCKPDLIPFSPSYSPLPLHLDPTHFQSASAISDGENAYWMGQIADETFQQWPEYFGDTIIPSSSSIPFDVEPSYNFPPSTYPHFARDSSPSSSSSSGRLSPVTSIFTSSSVSSRRSSIDSTPATLPLPPLKRRPSSDPAPIPLTKRCSHCSATTTPLWRRNPATRLPLCNACGLYLQQRGKLRPLALIEADASNADDAEEGEGAEGSGPECSHCHTRKTSVWRRSKTGAKLCNACGVYVRLRGRDRPLSLKRNKIKPRCKHPQPPSGKR